jgi:hypothetical protein
MSAGAPTRSAGQPIRTHAIKVQTLVFSIRFRFTLVLIFYGSVNEGLNLYLIYGIFRFLILITLQFILKVS